MTTPRTDIMASGNSDPLRGCESGLLSGSARAKEIYGATGEVQYPYPLPQNILSEVFEKQTVIRNAKAVSEKDDPLRGCLAVMLWLTIVIIFVIACIFGIQWKAVFS